MKPSERIDALANYLGISVKALSERIGLPHPQSLYDIQKGKTQNISNNMAGLILKEFPLVSKAWLLTGEGDMLIGDTNVSGNHSLGVNNGSVTHSFNSQLESSFLKAFEASQTQLTTTLAQLSTSQTQLINSQSQTTALIEQLAKSQQQISELINLLKDK